MWSKFFQRKGQKPPLVVAQSHGLEHIMHLQILEEAKQGHLQLSWKYPLYHGGFRLWEVAESFRQADLVCLLNQADADYTINHLGVDPQKVHVFPNGIPDYFLNRPFQLLPNQPQQQIGIAHIGTYISRKGIRYGIPALNAILARHPHVTVKVIGTGCPVANVLADFDPQVHDRVQVIPHYVHHNLPEILQDCQILLFPSLSEGFPLAIPEAMACGLTPIVTNIPGSTEIVMNEVNGLVVPVRDRETLIQAMERLIHNTATLNQLRHAAYHLAQDYSWQNIAKQRLNLYESVLSRQSSRKAYILV
jgi:glycosyltransferase involved in cell wall biosynthesis